MWKKKSKVIYFDLLNIFCQTSDLHMASRNLATSSLQDFAHSLQGKSMVRYFEKGLFQKGFSLLKFLEENHE